MLIYTVCVYDFVFGMATDNITYHLKEQGLYCSLKCDKGSALFTDVSLQVYLRASQDQISKFWKKPVQNVQIRQKRELYCTWISAETSPHRWQVEYTTDKMDVM